MLPVEISRFSGCDGGVDCPLNALPAEVANPEVLRQLCEGLGLEVVSDDLSFTAICQAGVSEADLLIDPYARCGQAMMGS